MKHNHRYGPDLAVIDAAIQCTENGYTEFTCFAISRSLLALHGEHDYLNWLSKYRSQYRAFCMANALQLHTARWWDKSHTTGRKKWRIAALKAFRQACIDAHESKK